MKNVQPILTLILSAVCLWVLFAQGLPRASVQAAQPTPTLLPTQPAPEPQADCDPSRSVQVSGSAVIHVTPDRAVITLGVESSGSSVNEVEAANTRAIQAVISAVGGLGVEAKDIATDWYAIEPVYENYDSLFIKGYRIHNQIAVTLRDAGLVNRLTSAALRAGANQVINVNLSTSELRKYRDQARGLAMQAAREKATALARAAGAQAGCVLSISENSWSAYNGGYYGYYGGYGAQSQNQMTQNVSQNAVSPAPAATGLADDEPISLGQISIKAEVSASFALK